MSQNWYICGYIYQRNVSLLNQCHKELKVFEGKVVQPGTSNLFLIKWLECVENQHWLEVYRFYVVHIVHCISSTHYITSLSLLHMAGWIHALMLFTLNSDPIIWISACLNNVDNIFQSFSIQIVLCTVLCDLL